MLRRSQPSNKAGAPLNKSADPQRPVCITKGNSSGQIPKEEDKNQEQDPQDEMLGQGPILFRRPTFNGRLDHFAYTRPTTRAMSSSSSSLLSPSPISPKTLISRRTPFPSSSGATNPASALTETPANGTLSPPKRRLTGTESSTPTPFPLSPSTSPNSSPRKKPRRSPAGYAPPSRYAHLPLLPDVFAPNLVCVFIGVNPGVRTAQTGHAYSHPSNLFWKLLHSSGLTSRRLDPVEDVDLPRLYGLGNTNIVARPSANQSELSKREMDAGVAILEAKIKRWRPEAVCIVGKGIWESVWRVKHGKAITKHQFHFGWQAESENMGAGAGAGAEHDDGSNILGGPEGMSETQLQLLDTVKRDPAWKGARVFVATSTSGLAASLRPHEKEAIWKPLGDWAIQRRKERNEWIDTDRLV